MSRITGMSSGLIIRRVMVLSSNQALRTSSFTIALSRAMALRLSKKVRKSSLRLRKGQRDLRLRRLRRCSVSPACLQQSH